MIKDVIDELIQYVEFCAYADITERVKAETDIKTRYDSKFVDEIKVAMDKVINCCSDELPVRILNDCCDVFELSKKEREEIVSRLKNGEYAK